MIDLLPELWPTQRLGIDGTRRAIARGERRICVTSPTGGGKSRMMCELIEEWAREGLKVVLYTNRRMLLDQLSKTLAAHGIWHGVRSAGYEDDRDFPVQISSIQTEAARVLKGDKWHALHDAQVVVVDEAHVNKGDTALTILSTHEKAGAVIVGFTATPIDLGEVYTHLVVAGLNSDLRKAGALLPAIHYGPDEPDLRHIKVVEGKDLTEAQATKAMMTPTIFGRVYERFLEFNPKQKPSIGFAPSVGAAKWFCEQFWDKGISCAAIDGKECWVDGKSFKTSGRLRDSILAGSKAGEYKIIWNRFVLREGIDCPWLAHGIFATVFGSLQSYLQSGGRLLRFHPSLDCVTVQDHGGNWHRHGSLNSDWAWDLGRTSGMIHGLRIDDFRAGKQREPRRCPRCSMIFNGIRCKCGYMPKPADIISRPVVQVDGSLKEMCGDIYQPRRLCKRNDVEEIWKRMYYRCKSRGATFRQAEALFAMENYWGWPPRTLPLMPIEPVDFYFPVDQVPWERLRH